MAEVNSTRVVEIESEGAKVHQKPKKMKIKVKPVKARTRKPFKKDSFSRYTPTDKAVLYVGHLPLNTGEDQLREYFNQFGKVKSCYCPKSAKGKTKGYGFIDLGDSETAKIAAKVMNGYIMFNKMLKVQIVERPHKNLFNKRVTNLKEKHQQKQQAKLLQQNSLKTAKSKRSKPSKSLQKLKAMGFKIQPLTKPLTEMFGDLKSVQQKIDKSSQHKSMKTVTLQKAGESDDEEIQLGVEQTTPRTTGAKKPKKVYPKTPIPQTQSSEETSTDVISCSPDLSMTKDKANGLKSAEEKATTATKSENDKQTKSKTRKRKSEVEQISEKKLKTTKEPNDSSDISAQQKLPEPEIKQTEPEIKSTEPQTKPGEPQIKPAEPQTKPVELESADQTPSVEKFEIQTDVKENSLKSGTKSMTRKRKSQRIETTKQAQTKSELEEVSMETQESINVEESTQNSTSEMSTSETDKTDQCASPVLPAPSKRNARKSVKYQKQENTTNMYSTNEDKSQTEPVPETATPEVKPPSARKTRASRARDETPAQKLSTVKKSEVDKQPVVELTKEDNLKEEKSLKIGKDDLNKDNVAESATPEVKPPSARKTRASRARGETPAQKTSTVKKSEVDKQPVVELTKEDSIKNRPVKKTSSSAETKSFSADDTESTAETTITTADSSLLSTVTDTQTESTFTDKSISSPVKVNRSARKSAAKPQEPSRSALMSKNASKPSGEAPSAKRSTKKAPAKVSPRVTRAAAQKKLNT